MNLCIILSFNIPCDYEARGYKWDLVFLLKIFNKKRCLEAEMRELHL